MRRNLIPLLVAATALVGAAAFAAIGTAGPTLTPAQAQYAPRNTSPPTISDTTPQQGQTLTASPGTWTGNQPITFAYQWQRCNASGASCVAITGATSSNYTVQAADVGNTLRVEVTATNASGSSSSTSTTTSVVSAAGTGAVAVTNVSLPDRLLIDQVVFAPSAIRSRTAPFTVRVRVVDTRGRAVSGALVFLRSTPVVTTTPPEEPTGADGNVTFVVRPERDISIVYRRGYNLQFFVRARKPGENPLAGISTRRLTQVPISPA